MSKSRGNFLDPNDVVATLGRDGTRYTVLREVAFDRDSDVSWDSFVRRYNADLANDYGNLLNRSLSMTARYRGGERSTPTAGALAADLGFDRHDLRRGARGLPAPRGARHAVGLRGRGQQVRRGPAALDAGQGGQGRRYRGRRAPQRRARRPARGLSPDRLRSCALHAWGGRSRRVPAGRASSTTPPTATTARRSATC